MSDRSILSEPLLSHLNDIRITVLAQVRARISADSITETWLSSGSLGLRGRLASKWEQYRKALRGACIAIRNLADTLVWTRGDSSGNMTVKNVYSALISTLDYPIEGRWMLNLWKWNLQLKIKLFLWLVGNHKVLTWDTLQKKGWEGPGVCYLCKFNAEDIDHFLIHCKFTEVVWARLHTLYQLKRKWEDATVLDCFSFWSKDKIVPTGLTALACWHLWLERNKSIFEEKPPSHLAVIHRISGSFSWRPTSLNSIPNRVCTITHKAGFSLACFDGVALSNGECCRAGGIIKTLASNVIKWHINCRAGTNTKAELTRLWATLTLATLWSIKKSRYWGIQR